MSHARSSGMWCTGMGRCPSHITAYAQVHTTTSGTLWCFMAAEWRGCMPDSDPTERSTLCADGAESGSSRAQHFRHKPYSSYREVPWVTKPHVRVIAQTRAHSHAQATGC